MHSRSINSRPRAPPPGRNIATKYRNRCKSTFSHTHKWCRGHGLAPCYHSYPPSLSWSLLKTEQKEWKYTLRWIYFPIYCVRPAFPANTKQFITFVQRWSSLFDAGPSLYQCCTKVLCLLGCYCDFNTVLGQCLWCWHSIQSVLG